MIATPLSRRSFLKGVGALALTPVLAKLPNPKPIPPPVAPPPLPAAARATAGRITGWWWKPRPILGDHVERIRLYDGETLVEEHHGAKETIVSHLYPLGTGPRVTRVVASGNGVFGATWVE